MIITNEILARIKQKNKRARNRMCRRLLRKVYRDIRAGVPINTQYQENELQLQRIPRKPTRELTASEARSYDRKMRYWMQRKGIDTTAWDVLGTYLRDGLA